MLKKIINWAKGLDWDIVSSNSIGLIAILPICFIGLIYGAMLLWSPGANVIISKYPNSEEAGMLLIGGWGMLFSVVIAAIFSLIFFGKPLLQELTKS